MNVQQRCTRQTVNVKKHVFIFLLSKLNWKMRTDCMTKLKLHVSYRHTHEIQLKSITFISGRSRRKRKRIKEYNGGETYTNKTDYINYVLLKLNINNVNETKRRVHYTMTNTNEQSHWPCDYYTEKNLVRIHVYSCQIQNKN